MPFVISLILGALLMSTSVNAADPGSANTEYLADIQHRFILHQQAWGNLGINTCAYASGITPMPLKIKDKTYTRGLGHHAPGEIIIDLGGEYDTFEAEVGVQWLGMNQGSVVFQVFVDDKKKFDSSLMKETDSALPVKVAVKGADELRLVVTDGGDGVMCDCADWAEARLIRNPSAKPHKPDELFDIAPFAKVTTSDPKRMDGCRANRVQEFYADDLFMEDEIVPSKDGTYRVPDQSVIGLNWVEKRRPKLLTIEFADLASVPSADQVSVQYWAGESIWQGGWKPLKTTVEKRSTFLIANVDWETDPDLAKGTRKIRWILPSSCAGTAVRRLITGTPARTATADIVLQMDKVAGGGRAEVDIYNGSIIESKAVILKKTWDTSQPLHLKVVYTKPKYWRPDRTVLMLKLPKGACAIGMDDLTDKGCIYVPSTGAFAATASSKMTIEACKKQIASKKTVLERVREMPDQTFEQALAKTRNPIQSTGPILLSLACDNYKFIVEREGGVEFTDNFAQVEKTQHSPAKYNCLMRPVFGSGKSQDVTRHLDGGWLPVPVTVVKDGDIKYSQMSMAAPFNSKTLFVSEFTMENTGTKDTDASLTLSFLADVEKVKQAALKQEDGKISVTNGDDVLAIIEPSEPGTLAASITDGSLKISGSIKPGTRSSYYVYIPAWSITPEEKASITGGQKLRSDLEDYWNKVMSSAAQVQVPDELLANVIKASQVHCLMAARNEQDGERVAAWIASMSYGPLESEAHSVIRGMDLMGHDEFARKSLDFFIHRYNPEGFLTTGYTLMGTGWHLWTLGEHYELTKDANWLRGVAPDVARVCSWIEKQTNKTEHLDGRGRPVPEYGLMPPGVMADWNAFSFYFCLNGYYYAGLNHAGHALEDINFPGSSSYVAAADKLKANILKGYRWTQSRSPVYPLQNGKWVVGYPSQLHCAGQTNDFFPGEDGNRSWCYDVELGAHQIVPAGILDPSSAEVGDMMDHMEDVQFLSNGWFDYPAEKNHQDWFNLGGFAKVQPYYCRNGEIYAMRDEVKPFIRSYFNDLSSLLNTETLWLWEHFNRGGAWNKTHETGYFLQQTRFMMVMEHGNDLYLAPLVTSNWLKDGMTVALDNAPTRFGKVSYKIKSYAKQGFIEAQIDPPTRSKPDRLVIRLRHPEGKKMKEVLINGKPSKDFDPVKECVFIKPGDGAMSVKAVY